MAAAPIFVRFKWWFELVLYKNKQRWWCARYLYVLTPKTIALIQPLIENSKLKSDDILVCRWWCSSWHETKVPVRIAITGYNSCFLFTLLGDFYAAVTRLPAAIPCLAMVTSYASQGLLHWTGPASTTSLPPPWGVAQESEISHLQQLTYQGRCQVRN